MINGLTDSDLPASFRSADAASLDGQSSTLRETRWSLRLGVLAAVAGVFSWRVGPGELEVAAAVGIAAFLGALVLTLRVAGRSYEAHWYRGRAIAESIKTLGWRYAVGGDTFPVVLAEADADRLMADRISKIIQNAGEVPLEPVSGDQITTRMRDIRRMTLDDRKTVYISGRIDDQIEWYNRKAGGNKDSAKRWGVAVAAAYIVGIGAAVARLVKWTDADLLGVFAAVAGAAIAWSEMRQHRVLAASYALAAQELGIVRARLLVVAEEAEWAPEVSDSEDAISREHTMWLARHGHVPPGHER